MIKRKQARYSFCILNGIGQAIVEKVPVVEVLGFYKRFRDKN
jgi:hypothetical protein